MLLQIWRQPVAVKNQTPAPDAMAGSTNISSPNTEVIPLKASVESCRTFQVIYLNIPLNIYILLQQKHKEKHECIIIRYKKTSHTIKNAMQTFPFSRDNIDEPIRMCHQLTPHVPFS